MKIMLAVEVNEIAAPSLVRILNAVVNNDGYITLRASGGSDTVKLLLVEQVPEPVTEVTC